ncbi:MAG: hypothetical protein A2017_21300 [Lentisphaerae bacterium GWF2_44_16]|nr:MAG: hypothetical protein A2017_21300 [Lentisphaerae bacterium GWF2_44_16]
MKTKLIKFLVNLVFLCSVSIMAGDYKSWQILQEQFKENPDIVLHIDLENANDIKIDGALPCTGRWTEKKGMNFDGKASYINCGNTGKLNFDNNFSVELWVYIPKNAPGNSFLLSKAPCNIWNKKWAPGYQLFLRQGHLGAVLLCTGGRPISINMPYDIRDDSWHHLALVFERGKALKLYDNSVLAAELNITEDWKNFWGPVKNNNDLILGADYNDGTLKSFFKGTIDELILYKSALTPSDIEGHYKEGKPLEKADSTGINRQTCNPPTVNIIAADGIDKKDIILENSFIKLVIAPYCGGRVKSFCDKTNGKELTQWTEHDIFSGLAFETVPEILKLLPYTFTIEKNNDSVNAVLSYSVPNGNFKGLEINKVISLNSTDSFFKVNLSIKNNSSEPRYFSVAVKQCIRLGQNENTGNWHDYFTWPTSGGLEISMDEYNSVSGYKKIQDIREGWAAISSSPSGEAVVGLFDKTQVEKGYSWFSGKRRNDIEWHYKPVELAKTESWQTSYRIGAVNYTNIVINASDKVVTGLFLLNLKEKTSSDLTITPLSVFDTAYLKVQNGMTRSTMKFKGFPGKSIRFNCIWNWEKSLKADLQLTENCRQDFTLNNITINRKNIIPENELKQKNFPMTENFFPFGGYIVQWFGFPNEKHRIERIYNEYKSSYFNTVTADIDTNVASVFEKLSVYKLRIIPRLEMVRSDGRDHEAREELLQGKTLLEKNISKRRKINLAKLKKTIEQYNDYILGYDISDEPGSSQLANVINAQNAFYSHLDKNHPAFPVLSGHAIAYAGYVPVFYRDRYPITVNYYQGSNPWVIAKDVKLSVEKTQAPVWFMLQGFSGASHYLLPNEAEMRLMLYSVIANGGKGIMFHGLRAGLPWLRYIYPGTLIDSWGMQSPAWHCVVETAKNFTPIGHLLTQTSVVTFPGQKNQNFSIQSSAIHYGETIFDVSHLTSNKAKSKNLQWLQSHGFISYKTQGSLRKKEEVFYDGDALTAGVLKKIDSKGVFLVIQNQDIQKNQTGTLEINNQQKFKLWDLYSLSEAGKYNNNKIKLQLNLLPGDGRIFYWGPAGETNELINNIYANIYDVELTLLNIKTTQAKINNIDIKQVLELIETSAQVRKNNINHKACGILKEAEKLLSKVISSTEYFNGAIQGLEKIHENICEADSLLTKNVTTVLDVENMIVKKWGTNLENALKPEFQTVIDELIKLASEYATLSEAVYYEGKAKDVLADIKVLSEKSEKIKNIIAELIRNSHTSPIVH